MENVNTIEKMEFQFQIENEQNFHVLSDEISKIITDHLEDFIDKVLLQFGIPHQQIIIPRLELDLGKLNFIHFKDDLIERFQSLFFKSLQQVIKAPQVNKMSQNQRAFYVIEYYIKFGSRPWWLEKENNPLEKFLHIAYTSNPRKFYKLLNSLHQNLNYRKRMIDAFSENLLTTALSHQYQLNPEYFAILKSILIKYNQNSSSYQISLTFKNLLLFLYFHKGNLKNEFQINDAIIQALYQYSSLNIPSFFRQKIIKYKNQKKIFWDKSPTEQPTVEQEDFNTKELMLFNWLHFYLENGFIRPEKGGNYYNFRNINYLFLYVLKKRPQAVIDLLLQIGRKTSVKKRFLEKITQENITLFFSKVAPSKRKLTDWVFVAFKRVQDEYQPINQTFTQVKKSINDIIFEVFLSGKLNGINDQNYLRLIFKQTAAKYGINYAELISLTLKALLNVENNERVSKFYQALYNIYHQDFIQNEPLFVKKINAKSSENKSEKALGELKQYLFNLTIGTTQASFSITQINTYLDFAVKSKDLLKPEVFLSIVEDFTTKFKIPLIQGVLPILFAQSSEPILKLPKPIFEKLSKKYSLNGLIARKKANPNTVIEALYHHHQYLEKKYVVKTLLSLQLKEYIEHVDFKKVSFLIYSKEMKWISKYMVWVDHLSSQVASLNKSEMLLWFYYQLLVNKASNHSLKFFKNLTIKHIQLKALARNENIYLDFKKNDSWLDFTKTSEFAEVSYKNQLPLQSFFGILGREEILKTILNGKKIEDNYLFQLMLTKYKSPFFDILLTHQFNEEFKQYLLDEAPSWLRKNVIKFLANQTGFEFEQQTFILFQIFTQNKWLDLQGLALTRFIEHTLWPNLFSKKLLNENQLKIYILQEAIPLGHVSKKIIPQFSTKQFPKNPEEAQNVSINLEPLEMDSLEGYFENSLKISEESMLGLFKELIESQQFPKWHPFHQQKPLEFKTYLNKLIRNNPKILKILITEIQNKSQLFFLLQLLNEEHVLIFKRAWADYLLILPLANTPELLLDLFEIKNPKMRMYVIRTGLLKIFFLKKSSLNQFEFIKEWIVQMRELGVVSEEKIMIQTDWEKFFEKIKIFTDSLSPLMDLEDNLYTKPSNATQKIFIAPKILDFSILLKLLLNSSNRTWEQYDKFLLDLTQSAQVPKNHLGIIKDWLRIAKTTGNRKYIQKVLHIYGYNELWRHSSNEIVENKLFFDVAKLLITNEEDIAQFVSAIIQENNHLKIKIFNQPERFQKEFVEAIIDQVDLKQRVKVFQSLDLWISNLYTEVPLGNKTLILGGKNIKPDPELLKGISVAQLLFYPNNFSINTYEQFFKQLNHFKIIPSTHSKMLKEWVDFTKRFGFKHYLHKIAQAYVFHQLWKEKDKAKVQALLVQHILDTYIGSSKDYQQFQKNVIEFNFKEIKGVLEVVKQFNSKLKNEAINKLSIEIPSQEKIKLRLSSEEDIKEFLIKGQREYNKYKAIKVDQQEIKKLIRQLNMEDLLKNFISYDVYSEVIELKKPQVIADYFKNLKDPNLKKIKGNILLKSWFELLFHAMTKNKMADLLRIFHQTFYMSSSIFEIKVENFLLKILQVPWFENALESIAHEKPNELQLFIESYPNLRGYIFPMEIKDDFNGEKALERFLKYGVFPKTQEMNIEELISLILKLKGKDLDRFKLLIFRMIQTRQGRVNMKKILPYVKEEWLYGLIHPDLFQHIIAFEKLMKLKIGIDVFSLLRSKYPTDRMMLVLSYWSTRRPSILHPLEIFLGIFDNILEKIDVETFKRLLSSNKNEDRMFIMLKNSSVKFKLFSDKHIDKTKEATKKAQEEQEIVDYTEGVSVYNAGLVFYWPFLGRFFTSLELVDKEGMKGEASTERCIQLLQYIATGSKDFEEWDLTLNKILCGVGPDFPVSTSFEPTLEEEELCERLVNATIYNWEKLRGTKPETFRETFVQREGRLYNRDNRWELMVEKKAYDVLLDSLPWSISMITLSWMKTRLLVEWK